MPKQMTIYLPDETYKTFSEKAREQNRSLNWLMNRVLDFYHDQKDFQALIAENSQLRKKIEEAQKIIGKLPSHQQTIEDREHDRKILAEERSNLETYDKNQLSEVLEYHVRKRVSLLNMRLTRPISEEEYRCMIEDIQLER